MKLTYVITVALAALLLASCCNCGSKSASSSVSLVGQQWHMTRMDGEDFRGNGSNYWIEFNNEGRISGRGDCNTLMGAYTADDKGRIAIDRLATTRMFCPNQNMENRFVKLVTSADHFRIDNGLLLFYQNSELVAVFESNK